MSECAICYEDINENTGSTILSCKHIFHLRCITEWFIQQAHSSCPCCRKEMGEKENLIREREDISIVSGPSETSEQGLRITELVLSRRDFNDIPTVCNIRRPRWEVDEYTWNRMEESIHYRTSRRNGETCIHFSMDELASFIMSYHFIELTRDNWNNLVKKHIETVSLNHIELNNFERILYEESGENPYTGWLTPIEIWNCMFSSDLYIKGDPTYPGEKRISFTFAQLSSHTTNTLFIDLTLEHWKNLIDRQKVPLTGAFMSASLDFSRTIYLPRTFSPNGTIIFSNRFQGSALNRLIASWD